MTDHKSGFLIEEKGAHFWTVPVLRQTFVMFCLMAVMFSAGCALGTATVMMPQLKKTNEIPVDDEMASWIYAGQGLGSVPTVMFIPYLSQQKGYKLIFILFVCIPMIVSCVLQYFATNAVQLLVAAVLQGMTMGGNSSLGIVAITEYSGPRLRSMFLVLKGASYFWGIWVANGIGTFVHWRYIPLCSIWPALFSLSFCFLWPEGPYWLASKGRVEECRKSFQWLRGKDKDLDELTSIIRNQTQNPKVNYKGNRLKNIKDIITLRHFYMPLVINCILYCSYYFTGKIVSAVYAIVIIKDITKSDLMAYTGMFIIDGVTVAGMYLGSYVALKVKRRSMFLSTSALAIFFLYILSLYLSLVTYQVISQNSFISLSLLVAYSFSVSWGPMVLSTSFVSEITPMRFKSFIVSVSFVVFWFLHTISLKFAPILFKNLGMHGSFAVYGTLTLICWIFLYKYLPETRNKTLQELELYFIKTKDDTDVNDKNEHELMLNHDAENK